MTDLREQIARIVAESCECGVDAGMLDCIRTHTSCDCREFADRILALFGEPVAWLVDIEDDYPHATIEREDAERDAEHARAHTGKPTTVRPLYAPTPARRDR